MIPSETAEGGRAYHDFEGADSNPYLIDSTDGRRVDMDRAKLWRDGFNMAWKEDRRDLYERLRILPPFPGLTT